MRSDHRACDRDRRNGSHHEFAVDQRGTGVRCASATRGKFAARQQQDHASGKCSGVVNLPSDPNGGRGVFPGLFGLAVVGDLAGANGHTEIHFVVSYLVRRYGSRPPRSKVRKCVALVRSFEPSSRIHDQRPGTAVDVSIVQNRGSAGAGGLGAGGFEPGADPQLPGAQLQIFRGGSFDRE